MEVFRYATSAELEDIKASGGLNPKKEGGYVHGIPNNPLLLGSQAQEIMENCKNFPGIPL